MITVTQNEIETEPTVSCYSSENSKQENRIMQQEESTSQSVETLVVRFRSQELPKTAWNHESHIQVAFWYNWHFSFEEALQQVRQGIIAYNEAVGTLNTNDSGYHETLTVYWMRISRRFLVANKYQSIEEAIRAFIATDESEKTSPFRYYTKEALFSVKARHQWVDGNLQTVPEAENE